jgi:hypothetical protein
MQGLGGIINKWALVNHSFEKFARSVQYNRSGIGNSESLSRILENITAVDGTKELDRLLKNAQIASP